MSKKFSRIDDVGASFGLVLVSILPIAMLAIVATKARGAELPVHIGQPIGELVMPAPPIVRGIEINVTMTRRKPSHRAFVRRLLSPAGPRGRLE